jgi:hypothetical protein
MSDHQLYLNLGDNRWLIARCACGNWRGEKMLEPGQRTTDAVRELEEDFERHAGLDPSAPYTPALPTD